MNSVNEDAVNRGRRDSSQDGGGYVERLKPRDVLRNILLIGLIMCIASTVVAVLGVEDGLGAGVLAFSTDLAAQATWFIQLAVQLMLGLYAVLFGSALLEERREAHATEVHVERTDSVHRGLALLAQFVAASSIPIVLASLVVSFEDPGARARTIVVTGTAAALVFLGGFLYRFDPFGRIDHWYNFQQVLRRTRRLRAFTKYSPRHDALRVVAVCVLAVMFVAAGGGALEALWGQADFLEGAIVAAVIVSVVALVVVPAVAWLLAQEYLDFDTWGRHPWRLMRVLLVFWVFITSFIESNYLAWPFAMVCSALALCFASSRPRFRRLGARDGLLSGWALHNALRRSSRELEHQICSVRRVRATTGDH